MGEILRREAVYLWYYCDVQLRQIFRWWLLGMLIGSAVSVFLKEKIYAATRALGGKKAGLFGLAAAGALGIASPLCMYGTVPVAASLSKGGVDDGWLAAFMMSSILLNPQLLAYSAALGRAAAAVRLVSCFVCGVAAGLLVKIFCRGRPFFDFRGFDEPQNRDVHPNILIRFVKNFGRNVRATGIYFVIGIVLSALFQRYVPAETTAKLFGGNEAWGVLIAATAGVPLYACGGGTIPLLREWLADGMSLGSASAFMIAGPATKITNLGALKIILGARRFALYIAFVMASSLITGILVNIVLR